MKIRGKLIVAGGFSRTLVEKNSSSPLLDNQVLEESIRTYIICNLAEYFAFGNAMACSCECYSVFSY